MLSKGKKTNKQRAPRQNDVMPCVHVGYRCAPSQLSPHRTLARPDKLILGALWALQGKTMLMLATVELIGSPWLVSEH